MCVTEQGLQIVSNLFLIFLRFCFFLHASNCKPLLLISWQQKTSAELLGPGPSVCCLFVIAGNIALQPFPFGFVLNIFKIHFYCCFLFIFWQFHTNLTHEHCNKKLFVNPYVQGLFTAPIDDNKPSECQQQDTKD